MPPPDQSDQPSSPSEPNAASGPGGGLTGGPGGDAAPKRSTTNDGDSGASRYLHPRTLSRLGSMEMRAKLIVEGVMSGMHRSPSRGVSIEFAQHRPYVAGDDLRHLDWKVYGRTDKLHLKQYEQETNLDLVLLVDSSGSMNYGSRLYSDASGLGEKVSPDGRTNWTKYDHATALAAALAFVTLQQGDRAGLGIIADELRAIVSRSNKRAAWRQIITALSTHPVDAPTNLTRVMDQVLGKVGNRCLFALITDGFEDIDRVRTALARVRHRGHDLILFQVLDKAETEFAFTDRAPFVGLEGEPSLRVDPRAIRKAYLEQINQHLAQVEKQTLAFGFDYCRVSTHDWLGPPLAAYLARRNARLKRSKPG